MIIKSDFIQSTRTVRIVIFLANWVENNWQKIITDDHLEKKLVFGAPCFTTKFVLTPWIYGNGWIGGLTG